ncbi:MAG: 4Fe-4S binding protein [Clostridiales bacterium]|nr:4Fe-4S binding protein [Clostridiales bacterium]MCD7828478.1 4Fe-4S binding protein [Clostridiales bacterium]
MSIRINENKCVSCQRCSEVCPGGLIDINAKTGKAQILYPEDCWGCTSCLKECSTGAIEFFLGPDIGNEKVYMQVEKKGSLLNWKFYDENGLIRTITVDSQSSNKY